MAIAGVANAAAVVVAVAVVVVVAVAGAGAGARAGAAVVVVEARTGRTEVPGGFRGVDDDAADRCLLDSERGVANEGNYYCPMACKPTSLGSRREVGRIIGMVR